MNKKDFHILLEKFIDQEISEKELKRLEKLASQDPKLKKEYYEHHQAILAIKSNALRDELKSIMGKREV